MYVDTAKSVQNGKTYIRHLLRTSYRENGKVKNRTIASLGECSEAEITAIKLALKHKNNLSVLSAKKFDVETTQGVSIGAVWLLFDMAKQLGIVKALGNTISGKLALWQVIARIIDQGSRLSAVRLATRHAITAVLGLDKFDEDDLYANLDWLTRNQEEIENKLFAQTKNKAEQLFLYDVTSSYLEGKCNELAAYGYNRDGKRGKLQVVIGLLCDQDGVPVSIEVFPGNTGDIKTFASQVKKAAERFGVERVTFVGDRGMIKSAEIKDLKAHGFYHITAITKPQIQAMLNSGTIQLSLFDETLHEIIDNGERFVLRRNPTRAQEIEESRNSKLATLEKLITNKNNYLQEHKRAKVEIAVKSVVQKAQQLKIADWVIITNTDRAINLTVDEQKLQEKKELDGCYVIKTDLPKFAAKKTIVHDRYKDLALVERAFRTSKTVLLELRPIYVRLASRTKGHALVVMLAYRIIKELTKRWQHLDLTVEEGIKNLTTLCTMEVKINGEVYNQIPAPNKLLQQLFKGAKVVLPKVLPKSRLGTGKVGTRKKLPSERKML